jgi:hypothetical protein
MKLGDFLNTMAQKSKIELDFGTLSNKKLEELNMIEIDDTVAGQFDSTLMSLDGAKNNPEVLNHFKPIILKAVDNKYAILAEKYGLGEDFTNEKNTYKKADLLEAKIDAKLAELEAQKGKGGNAEKEQLLAKQLGDLQTQLSALTEKSTNDVKAVTDKYENEITEMYVKNVLAGKKFATKDLPIEVNTQMARLLIDKQLKEKGAMLVRKDGELKLVQSALPDMDYYQDNKPVSFSDFTNKILADNKLLEVSQPAQQTQQQTVVQTSNQNTAKFDNAAKQSLDAITQTT